MPLVNQSIADIKKKIKKDNLVFWFYIKKNNASLISKGKTKKDAKKELIKKINAKPNKYIGSRLWRIDITLHDRSNKKSHKKVTMGDVLIRLYNYTVVEYDDCLKIKSKSESGKTGSIWFTKKWLEFNTWKKNILYKLLKKLLLAKKRISSACYVQTFITDNLCK